MGLVAVERLRWGDGWIEPGEIVPENEEGRDYDWLLRHGHVAPVAVAGDEQQLREELQRVTAERDQLATGNEPAVELNDENLPAELDGVPLVDGRPGGEHGREVSIVEGTEGEYRKVSTVRAVQLAEPVKVITPHGVMDGHAGDWMLVNDGNGEAWPVDPEYLDEYYELVVDAPDPESELPDGVTDLGGGWYQLADGETKVHGRKALDAALASA